METFWVIMPYLTWMLVFLAGVCLYAYARD